MEEQLIFAQQPSVMISTNTFHNCRIPIRYKDVPVMEFVKELTTFTSQIPIFHPDGTKLAVAKGSQIYPTEQGKKAGVTRRCLPDVTVCEINGKPAFEIRRQGPAALAMTAELYTFDGIFLKMSTSVLDAFAPIAPGTDLRQETRQGTALSLRGEIGGAVLTGCTFADFDVGIQIGESSTALKAAIRIHFGNPPK